MDRNWKKKVVLLSKDFNFLLYDKSTNHSSTVRPTFKVEFKDGEETLQKKSQLQSEAEDGVDSAITQT